jgi:hypothetical protein
MRAGARGGIRGVWLLGAFCLAMGCSSEEAPPVTPAGTGGGGGASPGDGGDTGSSRPVVVDADGTTLVDAGSATCSISTYVLSSRPAAGDAAANACEFPLTVPPPDPFNVRVRTGVPSSTSTTIPFSVTDGWAFTPGYQTIVLLGSYCQAAVDGKIGVITVDYGCINSPVP